MRKSVLWIALVLCCFAGISCKNIVLHENELVIKLDPRRAAGAQKMKVVFVTDKVVRVIASPTGDFAQDTSLMVLQKAYQPVRTTFRRSNDTLYFSSQRLTVRIVLPDAKVAFLDSAGNTLLTEYDKVSRVFTPVTIEGKHFYSIQQIFDSPADEAFYGLGQHQDGWMNYKGKDVDLYQYNSKVSIPFVVSSKKYGLLWDNYSQSRFGDSREYEPISKFKLYTPNKKEGGLEARYYAKTDTNKVFVVRSESDLTYEFLTDLHKLPAGVPLNEARVRWTGYIESDTTGEHKFRLYAAGYIKMWVEGTLVVDRWRQAWNPTANYFTWSMEKGKKYAIRIEWDPDGGESYLGLRALKPLPDDLQNKLSLWSEVAHQIDYYFIAGDNMDDVIHGYRTITGKAPIMPKWALGFWQSRERYKTQDELLNVVAEYRKRQIPFDNIVLDWFYWPQDKWGSHDFDSARFPDPVGMINKLHNEYHAHIMISVWGKFYEGIENYKKLDEKGYLYRDNILKGRKDWVYPGYKNTFYDAMNPDARKMFWEMMREKLYTKGIDAWWMDASEPDIHSNLPPEERKAFMNPTALGPGAQYFNAYPLCNALGIYEGQRSVNPDQRVFILTRSAYAGQQRYAAATWSGDVGARWEELKLQIPAGLNFCIAGIPYWTTDIGGFAVERKYEQATGTLLEDWRERNTRWFQYGTFCPIFRVHGQFPYREIFNIAPEGHQAYRTMVNFVELRYRLMPYIYSLAASVYFDDYTIMRPLVMDFLDDKTVYDIADQFMFGPALMVCPVYQPGQRSRKVYLPDAKGWYDLYSGKFFAGKQTTDMPAPYERIPLLVKAGSIIPVGPKIQYALQKTNEPIDIYVYTGDDANFSLYFDDGVTYQYEKGKYLRIPLTYSEQNQTLTIGKAVGNMGEFFDHLPLRIILITPTSPKALLNNTNYQAIDYTGSEVTVKFSGRK
ncbi:MAG: TIM-barrel domain-containing protein [Bacteroidales bacterium]|nr:glycoside hydrolase family 31 protein [Bacteroidales bacterium]